MRAAQRTAAGGGPDTAPWGNDLVHAVDPQGRAVTASSPRRPATIIDVAREAGISHATVSRYLNGRSYVSATARSEIERAIATVGYVPNSSARALVSRRTASVAFIVREDADLFFDDATLVGQARGANAALSDLGYQLQIMIVDSAASEDRIRRLVSGRSVDGALLSAMSVDDPLARALHEAGVPLVTASEPLPGTGVPSVDIDNRGAAHDIARRLRETGRHRIVEVRGPTAAPVSALRHAGVLDALGADLPGLDAADWTADAGRDALRVLLDRHPDLDGVVTASDSLAVGAIAALETAGRAVPDDVGVVGFDDSPWAERSHPPLSTVRQDGVATGRRMAEIMSRLLSGDDQRGRREIMPTTIVWRGSA